MKRFKVKTGGVNGLMFDEPNIIPEENRILCVEFEQEVKKGSLYLPSTYETKKSAVDDPAGKKSVCLYRYIVAAVGKNAKEHLKVGDELINGMAMNGAYQPLYLRDPDSGVTYAVFHISEFYGKIERETEVEDIKS